MAHFESTIRIVNGPVLPGATVTVFGAGTLTPAALFSDKDLTVPLTNPLIASEAGIVDFYVASDEYDILIQRFDIKDRKLLNVSIIEAVDSGNPTGPAGGDLGGTYPNPTVVGIQGRAIVNPPVLDRQVIEYDIGTDSLQWAIASASSDPFEVAFPANNFKDLNGFDVQVGTSGVFMNLNAGNDHNYVCTTHLPPSFYEVSLFFEIMVDSSGLSDNAFLTFDVVNGAPANAPAQSILQTVPVAGSPDLITLGVVDLTGGTILDGMVHVIIGRDVSQDNMTGSVRVYFVRIRPTL